MLSLLQSHLTAGSTNKQYPCEFIYVNDTTKFMSNLKTLSETQEYQICVFTAGVIDGSGKTWCSDCDRAKPFIETVLLPNIKAGEKVIYCEVEREKWSGRSDHPYK